jgi:hypothetical protein
MHLGQSPPRPSLSSLKLEAEMAVPFWGTVLKLGANLMFSRH